PRTSGGANPLSSPQVDQAGGKESSRHSGEVQPVASEAVPAAASGDDQVSLSVAARAAGSAEAGSSATGIPAERLHGILKRISSGYYDTPQVRDRVAQRLQSEFGTASPQ
ncbi:MAG: hypothetical protein ABI742_08905, partial [Gemmatimonadota bacterium]